MFTIKNPYDIIFRKETKEVKDMNQILATTAPGQNKNKKNKYHEPADIKKVMMVFSILLILFGIVMIGTGSYAIFSSKQNSKNNTTKPMISVENKSNNLLLLKVTHDQEIKSVTYSWNEQQQFVIQGNHRKYIEQEILIPAGTNTLSIIAKDQQGQEMVYEKQYEVESNINLEVVDNKIKVTYEGEKEISYMTYRWDEEDESRIEINSQTLQEEIEVQKGLHTLTIVLVDINNETETKVQKINGVSKPKLEITTDGESFIVKASDETALQKIEIILNEDNSKKYRAKTTEKEFEYKFPLEPGENKIEVTVYNSDDMTATQKRKYTK